MYDDRLRKLGNVREYGTKRYKVLFIKYRSGEIGGACGTYGRERRGAHKILVEKPEGRRPLGRSSYE
jgi:hypothetical protein